MIIKTLLLKAPLEVQKRRKIRTEINLYHRLFYWTFSRILNSLPIPFGNFLEFSDIWFLGDFLPKNDYNLHIVRKYGLNWPKYIEQVARRRGIERSTLLPATYLIF